MLFKYFADVVASLSESETDRCTRRQLDIFAMFLLQSEFKYPGFGYNNKGAMKHLKETKRIISFKKEN